MIAFVKECNLADFDFWSGAIYVANRINDEPNADDCWAYLEEMLNESGEYTSFTETNINDFVWFDAEDLLVDAALIERY